MHADFSGARVAVVGDLMLDRYLTGPVARLSPEAPVPVLRRDHERDVLGGAGNVAANLASLGAQVTVIGVVGEDPLGKRMRDLLGAFPALDMRDVVVDGTRPTTCKTRVMSGLHQLVRIDSEATTAVDGAIEDALLAALAGAVDWADIVVLSDYAKGVCTDRVVRGVIDLAARAGKPSVIDPKRQDFSVYAGASVIKPNRRELVDATRLPCTTDQEAERAARVIVEQTGSSMLLTRSEHGLSWFGRDGTTLHVPTAARDVFDVSGAGDTVLAATALGLAKALPITETMRLANMAAGIVVGKVGTAVVTAAELDAALAEDAHHPSFERGALVTLEEAVAQRQLWRRQGLRVGFTNGCFDLLHPGHVSLLRAAAEGCDKLIVAINTDRSVQRLKGPSRPVQDEDSRAVVLGALSVVDLVILFDQDTPAEAIGALVPDLLVKGADYAEDQVVGADVVKAAGGTVMLAPLVAGQSTSRLISRSLKRSG